MEQVAAGIVTQQAIVEQVGDNESAIRQHGQRVRSSDFHILHAHALVSDVVFVHWNGEDDLMCWTAAGSYEIGGGWI